MPRHYHVMVHFFGHSKLVAGLLVAGLLFAPAGIVRGQTGDSGEKGEEAEVRSGAEVVDSLLDRLQQSEDEATASFLEETIIRAWLDSGSDTINLLMARTVVAMQQGDLPLALDFSNAMVDLAPDYPEAWNKRATVLYLLKDYGRSLEDVERTLELQPRHFGALSGLGLILLEIGNKAGALQAFRMALDVHPFLENARQSVEQLELEVEGQGI